MNALDVAIVGTGPHPGADSHDGYSMGYRHANSYSAAEGCTIRGCADIVPGNVDAFLQAFDLDSNAGFSDHEQMLDALEPDIVSVCTPPATHPELVADCARHDAVRAIHCEKPMARTFGGSRRMVEICAEHDVQLTVNLQNRCSVAAARVRELVEAGSIGGVERVEVARHDLLQTGIHHIDLANFVVHDEPVEWVLGQVDYPEESVWYTDMHTEAQSLGTWEYASGIYGLCSTGAGMDAVGRSTNRIVGTDGRIEMDLGRHEFRIRTADSDEWEPIETGTPAPQDRTIQHIVDTLVDGEDPLVSGEVGLAATEIVFSIWESARRRGRVNLPLDVEDNPLESMITSGDLPPET